MLLKRPGKRRHPLRKDDKDLAWALEQVGRGGLELSRLSGGRVSGRRRGQPLAARYDSAMTSADNARHWALADALAADTAASPAVRQILRNRARYEVANNSYARGIVNTLANDTIGTGPRLRCDLASEGLNRLIVRQFAAWADEVGLADVLRLMRVARVQDGEAFAVLVTNEALRHGVKLSLLPIEADQVASPDAQVSATNIDGVQLDDWGNVKGYQVLRTHPGAMAALREYATVPAESMLHWFRADRPGQHRGLPELMPSLPLFAQLRRYTLAVADAAEAAADFAIVLYTDTPADAECDYIRPLDQFELERGMMTTMPEGWKPTQIRGEQPTTTYDMFVRAVLREIARCMGMPYCIAAGDSSGYNFASGRLDHKTYYKGVRIDQRHLERVVLDRLLRVWLREAALAGVVPAFLASGDLAHAWFWDGDEYADPLKEAAAITELLANGATNLPEVYSGYGQDWLVEMQRGAESLGLTLEEYQERLALKLFGPSGEAVMQAAKRRAMADEEEPPAETPAAEKGREGRSRRRETSDAATA